MESCLTCLVILSLIFPISLGGYTSKLTISGFPATTFLPLSSFLASSSFSTRTGTVDTLLPCSIQVAVAGISSGGSSTLTTASVNLSIPLISTLSTNCNGEIHQNCFQIVILRLVVEKEEREVDRRVRDYGGKLFVGDDNKDMFDQRVCCFWRRNGSSHSSNSESSSPIFCRPQRRWGRGSPQLITRQSCSCWVVAIIIQMSDDNRSFLAKLLSCDMFSFLDGTIPNPCLSPDYNNDDFSNFLSQYSQESFYNDPYFGDCYLLKHTVTGDYVIIRKQTHPSSQNCDFAYTRALQLKNYRNSHIVNLLGVDKKTQTGFIWSTYKLGLVYEYVFVDLEQEIDNRLRESNPYDEQELMLIMTQCIHGLYYLESRRIAHTAVRPRYLYIGYDKQMKVGYRDLFNYQSNYDCVRNKRAERHIYLAPEEVEDLAHGLAQPSNPQEKANVFSFGMIMLSMMSGHYLDTAYDYDNCIIRRQRIDEAIKIARSRFTDRPITIVQSMLADINLRTTFQNLAQRLISTSGRPVQITLSNQSSDKTTNVPFYSFDRPTRSDPSSYPNNLSKLLYPGANIHTPMILDRRTKQGRLHQLDDQNDLSLTTYLKVPKNNEIQYETGNIFIGQNVEQGTLEKSGKGMYRCANGQYYMGDWVNNKMHGHGLLYWNMNRIRYEGDFDRDEFHGKGVEYPLMPPQVPVGYNNIVMNNNWKKYEGEFIRDFRQGKGIVYFVNGWWEGNFKSNQPDGEGIWHPNNPNDPVVSGIWKMGSYASWVQPPVRNM